MDWMRLAVRVRSLIDGLTGRAAKPSRYPRAVPFLCLCEGPLLRRTPSLAERLQPRRRELESPEYPELLCRSTRITDARSVMIGAAALPNLNKPRLRLDRHKFSLCYRGQER